MNYPIFRAGIFVPLAGLGDTCAEIGGVIALLALFRRRGRAVSVFLSLVPLAGTVVTAVIILIGFAFGIDLPD